MDMSGGSSWGSALSLLEPGGSSAFEDITGPARGTTGLGANASGCGESAMMPFTQTMVNTGDSGEGAENNGANNTASSSSTAFAKVKKLLQRHQGVVTSLQYLSRAGIMFIPSTFELYEVAAEGCYSISYLIQYFNEIILEETVQRSTCIEDYMVLATKGVTYIEVLVEKIALALGGEFRRSQIVFFLELLKSACRLVMLADRRKPCMMIHWNIQSDPSQNKLDLSHYKQWYASLQAQRVYTADAAATTTGFAQMGTRLYPEGEEEEECVVPSVYVDALAKNVQDFQGQRSGLQINISLPLSSSHASACASNSRATEQLEDFWAIPGVESPEDGEAKGGRNGDSNADTDDDNDTDKISGNTGGCGDGGSDGQPEDIAYSAQFETLPHSLLHVKSGSGRVGSCAGAGAGAIVQRSGQSDTADMPIAAEMATVRGAELSEAPTEQQPHTSQIPTSNTSSPIPSPTDISLSSELSPEFYIVLGELLYVMRPAVYAWALHQVHKAYDDRHGGEDGIFQNAAGAGAAGEGRGASVRVRAGTDAEDDPMQYIPQSSGSGTRQPRHQQRSGLLVGRLFRRASASLWPSHLMSTVKHWKRSFADRPEPTGSRYSASAMQAIAAAVSLAVEVTSIRLTMIGLQKAREKEEKIAAASASTSNEASSSHSYSNAQLHPFDLEVQRRQIALLFYLLRTPLFDRTTLPLLQMAANMLERIPLIGSLPVTAINLLKYLNRTHFYTSASS